MRANIRITSISAGIAIASVLFAGVSQASPPVDRGSEQSGGGEGRAARLDTASSAIPTSADPIVSDHATSTVHTGGTGSKGVAAAVATSDCDGCAGTSTVFQIIHVDAKGAIAAADNSAAAWSSCAGCSSSAVSVQLVIARDPAGIAVNNRALALNVACEACTTSAAAIQFVLAGGTNRELKAGSRELISQIEAQLAERLAGAPAPSSRQLDAAAAQGLADETARRLEQIILADLGGTSLQRAIEVQIGG
jgi:hypothetical protein